MQAPVYDLPARVSLHLESVRKQPDILGDATVSEDLRQYTLGTPAPFRQMCIDAHIIEAGLRAAAGHDFVKGKSVATVGMCILSSRMPETLEGKPVLLRPDGKERKIPSTWIGRQGVDYRETTVERKVNPTQPCQFIGGKDNIMEIAELLYPMTADITELACHAFHVYLVPTKHRMLVMFTREELDDPLFPLKLYMMGAFFDMTGDHARIHCIAMHLRRNNENFGKSRPSLSMYQMARFFGDDVLELLVPPPGLAPRHRANGGKMARVNSDSSESEDDAPIIQPGRKKPRTVSPDIGNMMHAVSGASAEGRRDLIADLTVILGIIHQRCPDCIDIPPMYATADGDFLVEHFSKSGRLRNFSTYCGIEFVDNEIDNFEKNNC